MGCLRIYCLLTLIGLITVSRAQTCQKLDHQENVCVTDTEAVVTCPDTYLILIESATAHWKAQVSECPPPAGTAGCETVDATADIKSKCDKVATSCTYSILPPTASACGDQGVDFIDVTYRCIPPYGGQAADAIALGAEGSFDLTQVAIDGKPHGLLLTFPFNIQGEQYELKESDKSCHMSFPPNTEIEFHPHILIQYERLPTTGPCDQKFKIWDVGTSTVFREFCFGDDDEPVILDCGSETREFRTEYVTTNPDQSVIMQFVIRVADQSTFNIDCSHTFEQPTTEAPLTTESSRITDPDPVSTTDSNFGATEPDTEKTKMDDEGFNWKLVIILVCCALALLLLIIAVLIVLCRYKRDSEKEEELSERASNKSSNFTYVTEVYVDGDHRTKLVMDNSRSVPSRKNIQI